MLNSRSMGRLALGMISAILAVVFLAACATTQAPVNSDVVNPVSVGVAPAFTETIEAETTYAAVVQPKEQVDLSPMSSGRIHLMAVDVGFQVSRGDESKSKGRSGCFASVEGDQHGSDGHGL